MRTIILNGSARRSGFTKKMIDEFKSNATGEIDEIDCYSIKNISPCLDCRYCWKNNRCAINDGMQDIYKKIEEADVIVLATPIYFHSVTGKMKILIDRFQLYWASHIRKDRDAYKEKLSVILMCGGAPSFKNQFLGGEIVLKGLSGDLNATCKGIITLDNTDIVTEKDFNSTKEEIKKITNIIFNK